MPLTIIVSNKNWIIDKENIVINRQNQLIAHPYCTLVKHHDNEINTLKGAIKTLSHKLSELEGALKPKTEPSDIVTNLLS